MCGDRDGDRLCPPGDADTRPLAAPWACPGSPRELAANKGLGASRGCKCFSFSCCRVVRCSYIKTPASSAREGFPQHHVTPR